MLGTPVSTGVTWMVDPHLMVLCVLVAGWAIDKVLAVLEWVRRPRTDGAADAPGCPVETGGPVDTGGPADARAGGPTDARTDGHAGGGSRRAGAE